MKLFDAGSAVKEKRMNFRRLGVKPRHYHIAHDRTPVPSGHSATYRLLPEGESYQQAYRVTMVPVWQGREVVSAREDLGLAENYTEAIRIAEDHADARHRRMAETVNRITKEKGVQQ